MSGASSKNQKLFFFFQQNKKKNLFLRDFLTPDNIKNLNTYQNVEVISLATFPANDFNPGKGSSLVLFSKDNKGKFIPLKQAVYPMKIAARAYQGKHTGYRKSFLKSPLGFFGVHKGSFNGSRYVSWSATVAKMMKKAHFVPCFGLKIPKKDKPQKHFHYAIHSVPINYDEKKLKKQQLNSLGCFSLLVEDMRKVYYFFKKQPSHKRLFVSIYDTISIDIQNKKIYFYKDIYNKGTNTLNSFYKELEKYSIPFNFFDTKKVRNAMKINDQFCRIFSFSDLI